MIKSIFKELIIVLLLLLAIVLVLCVFLYDYIPTNKIVPRVEQYQVPNSIKEELEVTVNEVEEQKTQIVYEIDGTDLKNYEKTKDYQKGKVNPFAQEVHEVNPENDTNNNTNNNTNSSTNSTTNNSNSVGNYLPNTGTK